MNEKDLDKIYLLLKTKQKADDRSKSMLQDTEVEDENYPELYQLLSKINITDYKNLDIQTLEKYVDDRNEEVKDKKGSFESLSALLDGNGVEVDFDELEISESSEKAQETELLIQKKEEFDKSNKKQGDDKILSGEKKELFVIQVEDKKGNTIGLVIDSEGELVASISDNNKFELSPEFKQKLEGKLEEIGLVDRINIKTLEKEFIPQSSEQLYEMNESGDLALDTKTKKETSIRAIDAKNREDDEEQISIEPQERDVKKDQVKLVKDEDEPKKDDDELETQPDGTLKKPNKDKVKEEFEEEETPDISEEDKDDLVKVCEQTGRTPYRLVRKLTILEPKSATDTLDGDGLKGRGGLPIDVYQFKGIAGKDEYVLKQGNRILDRRYFDSDIEKLVEPLRLTYGVVKRVSDEKTRMDITTADGRTEDVKLQSKPSDLDQTQKQEMEFEIQKLLDKLKTVQNTDISDYAEPEDKAKALDRIELEIFDTFVRYGVTPPSNIRTAVEQDGKEELEPEEQEEVKDEHDSHDERTRWDDNSLIPPGYGGKK